MSNNTLVTFETRWGWVALVHDGSTVRRLTLVHPTEAAARRAVRDEFTNATRSREEKCSRQHEALAPEFGESLVARVRAYFDGEHDDFRNLPVDASYLTALGREVFEQCRRIPRGEVRTYGEIAAKVGRLGAARAIGNFMASNRTPLLVPCHRVVASGGRLGGFTAPGGIALKKRLLDFESAGRGY